MITPVSSAIQGGGAYGFGLELRTSDNRPTIWHGGRTNGFTAETDVFLDSGFARWWAEHALLGWNQETLADDASLFLAGLFSDATTTAIWLRIG